MMIGQNTDGIGQSEIVHGVIYCQPCPFLNDNKSHVGRRFFYIFSGWFFVALNGLPVAQNERAIPNCMR